LAAKSLPPDEHKAASLTVEEPRVLHYRPAKGMEIDFVHAGDAVVPFGDRLAAWPIAML
jgi:hypothetical protein